MHSHLGTLLLGLRSLRKWACRIRRTVTVCDLYSFETAADSPSWMIEPDKADTLPSGH